MNGGGDTRQYRILLDTPAQKPALGFDQDADALASVVQESPPRFAIGIFGGWGSGKTTLMRAIAERLDAKRSICVEFSAWRYEKEPHLIVPLLDTIREAVAGYPSGDADVVKQAKSVAGTIGRAMHSLVAGIGFSLGLPGAAEISFDANAALAKAKELGEEERLASVPRSFYHASFGALREAFAGFLGQGGRRIVVFVDDLDRCLPQGALEVLESMKLFFDIDGFVFVVGLDRAVVEACIDARYGALVHGQDAIVAAAISAALAGAGRAPAPSVASQSAFRVRGSDYIKKIFQIPYQLSPVAVTQIDDFMECVHREGGLPVDQQEEFRGIVAAHLPFLVTESGVNPREVKRYLNAYTLQRKTKPHLDPGVVLTFKTIAFRSDWAPVVVALYGWRAVFIGALRERVEEGNATALSDLDGTWSAIPESFLAYVSPGAPGHALLAEHVLLDDYLYAGEAANSGIPTWFTALIARLASLRKTLREAQASRGAEQMVSDESKSALQGLWTVLLDDARGLESVASLVPGRQAADSLRQITESLSELSLPEAGKLPDVWFAARNDSVTRTLNALLEMYRSGLLIGAQRAA